MFRQLTSAYPDLRGIFLLAYLPYSLMVQKRYKLITELSSLSTADNLINTNWELSTCQLHFKRFDMEIGELI